MWGAIIGDLAGSIYEYQQTQKFCKLNPQELISEKSFYSDDTIATIAILDAILNNGEYSDYLKKYVKEYLNYKPKMHPYFENTFSEYFIKWAFQNQEGTSIGNGAMMRISPVGYLFNQEEEVRKQARLATIPSHHSNEAISSATTIALIIYYARKGLTKEETIQKLHLSLTYSDFNGFNATCSKTIDNCLYALFTSNTFEESLLKVLSYGGDTDTNACIVGAMAEALYGVDEKFIVQARKKIPKEFVQKVEEGYKKVRKLS